MRYLSIVALLAAAGFIAAVDVAKYDTNKDGALSAEEIKAIADEADKKAIAALDANKDGAVSAEEAKAAAPAK